MADTKQVLTDPDFWAEGVTHEDRAFALGNVDKNFGSKSREEQFKFLDNLQKTRMDQQAREQKEAQERQQAGMAAKQEQGSWWNQNIAQPLNNIVGRGLEQVGNVGVPIARMAQGEPLSQALDPRGIVDTMGAGGEAKRAREQSASAIVPQEPWQAALMAAGPVAKAAGGAVPALGAVLKGSRAARIALPAGLAAAGEATMGQPDDSPLWAATKGALKAGAAATGVEALSGLSGWLGRIPLFGGGMRMAKADTGDVVGAVRKVVPDLNPPSKPAEAGKYFNEGGAKAAAETAFATKATKLDTAMANEPQWIQSQELGKAYTRIVKTYGKQPGGVEMLQGLKPDPGKGWKPSQAARIIALARETLIGAGGETMKKHTADEMVDNLVADVARNMPSKYSAQFAKMREDFRKASAVRDLFEGAFKPSDKGYLPDMRVLQKGVTDPDIARRLSAQDVGTLRRAATRTNPGQKPVPPGSQDYYPGESQYLPYPSAPGLGIYILRKLVHGNRFIGNKPLTAPAWQRFAGQAAQGSQASSVGKKIKEMLTPKEDKSED